MSTTIETNQTSLESINGITLLRGVDDTRFDGFKMVALLLNFQDAIESLLRTHQLDFSGAGIELAQAQDSWAENPFFEYAQQQEAKDLTSLTLAIFDTDSYKMAFVQKIYNLFASLLHVESTINLAVKNPDVALCDLSGQSIENLCHHASVLLFKLRAGGKGNYSLLMEVVSVCAGLNRKASSHPALNSLIVDFTTLLHQMALSYAVMNDSPVALELLHTERDMYNDTQLNQNEVVGTVTLPSYATQPNECNAYNDEGGFYLNALVQVPEDNAKRFAHALSYTLHQSCCCEHDCCGCMQVSACAEVVSSNIIHLSLRHYYNF